jgi:hypothetical protein
MKDMIKKKLALLTENKDSAIYGPEEIAAKIRELNSLKHEHSTALKLLDTQRNILKKKINDVDGEIKKWELLSPNQYKMFPI